MFSPSYRKRTTVVLGLCGVALALTGWGPGAEAAGSKKRDPTIAVRFHAQVNTFDPTFAAKVVAGNPPRELIVEKIPSLSEPAIAAFSLSRAADGSYSAVFQFDRHGQAVLEALSSTIRGQLLVAAVNGRPVSVMKVDKIVSDGIIFIPSGLNETDIRALGASFSLMGQTDSDKEAKKEPRTGPFVDPAIPDPGKSGH